MNRFAENQTEARAKLKAIRERITSLSREQKSIPLTIENVERKQSIQDEINSLESEFKAVSLTIMSH